MSSDAERKSKLKQAQKNMYELAANRFEELGLQEAGRTIGMGVRAAAKGITSIPDFASSIANLAGMAVGANPNIPLISDKISNQFDKITNNAFQPKTFGEKVFGTGLEFLSGGAAFNPAARAIGGKVGNLLTTQGAQQYASAAGAGAGLELGKEYAPDNAITQLGTSLLGGLGGAKAARGLSKPIQTLNEFTLRNIASNLFTINPEKLQAFKKAGIDPTLSNVSDSKILGMVENLAANTPFASTPIEKAILKTQEKISEYGSGISREKAGTITQKSLKDWREKGFKIIDKLQENVSRHIESYTPIKLTKTVDIIGNKPTVYTDIGKDILANSASGKKFTQIKSALEQVKNAAEQNLKEFYGFDKNSLSNPEVVQQFNNIKNSVEKLKHGDILPYSDAVIIRKSIDNTLDGKFGNVELGKEQINILKNLRKGIQDDISNTLEQISPQAAKDNARFNKFYNKFANKNDEAIAPLLEDKTVTETFRDIINNTTVDAAKAKTVFSTLKPEQKETFTKAIITELGSNPQNEFSSSTLATKFKKLDKEAQDVVLAGFTKEEKEKFKSTIDVIDAIKDTVATGNQSRTAYTGALLSLGAGFATNPIGTSLALALARLGSSKLLANPKFINWISKASNLKSPVEFEKHLSKLEILAKNSPQLSSNIQEFTDKLLNSEKQLQEASTWDENKEAEYQELAKLFESNPQEWNDETEAEYQELAKLFGEEQGNESNQEINNALINKIAQVESGGNPNAKAKTSTASGLLQFTNATWKDGVKKYGNELGITLRDKGDPEAQKVLASKILQNNSQALENVLERPPTDGELYISHFLGLEGAKKLLQSKKNEIAAKLFPAAAKANKEIFYKNGKPITTKQLIASLESKIA